MTGASGPINAALDYNVELGTMRVLPDVGAPRWREPSSLSLLTFRPSTIPLTIHRDARWGPNDTSRQKSRV